ncbi:hypothetical protein HUG20_02090 [Salicibibacter cibi]|uniref:Uncharacterized protein n=1 Tax=Salicibibacter cibi TaxID=2743001 RepID=A0A7T7CE97_9BACI|nr:hypothetical protein [Salicibibacter cibi]QQK78812.1 hypothetical protein HUG20_02090 [Salicibibacter cibi]
MARLQRKNGRVKPLQRRLCVKRLDRSSAESEAMEAASRLQLITASCSAFPKYDLYQLLYDHSFNYAREQEFKRTFLVKKSTKYSDKLVKVHLKDGRDGRLLNCGENLDKQGGNK